MGSDPPHQPLVLSDIIHSMSPSPGRGDEQRPQQRSHSPELLSRDDIIHMKVRLADMGFSLDVRSQDNGNYANVSPKEKELGDMVVKLLDSFIDPSQLLRQAEFIDWLGIQRDLLVQSFQEERQRWEAEREGWTRMAEALLAQRAMAGNSSQKDEESEHQYAIYESENKALREKLQDSQSRFSALETELNKLKPLLFMQPPPLYAATSSLHKSSTLQAESSTDSSPSKVKRRATDTSVLGGQEQNVSAVTPQGQARVKDLTSQDQDGLSQTQPRSEYYRRDFQSRSPWFSPLHSRLSAQSTPGRTVFSATPTPSTHPTTPKKSKSKHKKSVSHNLPPLTADARTEHLLLAARRIGRERANMVSGLMRRIEKEKEELMREREAEYLERERLQKATGSNAGSGGNVHYRKDLIDFGMGPGPTLSSSTHPTPKTPKRAPAGHATTHFLTPTLVMPRSDVHPPTNQTPNSFVFVGGSALAPYSSSTVSTTRPTTHPTPTTRSTSKPTPTPAAPSTATPHANNHPTPLASLLSAARSMMDDESSESSASPKVGRRTSALEHPESPLPKRRRVGNGSTSKAATTPDVLVATPSPGPDRFRSALDVLADQAAAVFNSDQHSPTKSTAKPTSRTKGKDRVATSSHLSVPSDTEDVDDSTPKGKSTSTRDSHSQMSTGSPVSTRSRSKALLTERLSKELTKTLHRRDGPADSQQRNAPMPRMVLSPGIRRIASPLASLPSRTPPRAASADNTYTLNTTSIPADAVRANEGMGGRDDSLDNTTLSLPRSLSTGDDRHATSGSPSPDMTSTYSYQLQPSAETPRAVSQGPVEKEASVRLTASPMAESDNRSELSARLAFDTSGSLQGGNNVEHVLNEGKGGDVDEESRGQEPYAVSSPPCGTPGTDADAEGEMDVDTENDEAVIVNSSVAHETISLATSSPRPGKPSVTPGETSAKRNTGERRTATQTKS